MQTDLDASDSCPSDVKAQLEGDRSIEGMWSGDLSRDSPTVTGRLTFGGNEPLPFTARA